MTKKCQKGVPQVLFEADGRRQLGMFPACLHVMRYKSLELSTYVATILKGQTYNKNLILSSLDTWLISKTHKNNRKSIVQFCCKYITVSICNDFFIHYSHVVD